MPFLGRFPGLPRVLNPYMLPLARKVPPLAVLRHFGRRTGRTFEAPVLAFPTGRGFLVALTYGHDPNWALNLLAAGQGEMVRAGRTYAISDPRRRTDAHADVPAPIAVILRAMDVHDFLEFSTTPR